jgi:AAA15 family ATPase/GTPase
MRIQNIQIKNFRCFENLEIKSLSRLNLFAGKNNTGKTSLLEALFLYCGAYNPNLTNNLNIFRGVDRLKIGLESGGATPWDYLFYGLDTNREIELKGCDDKGITSSISLRVLRKPAELEKIGQIKKNIYDAEGYSGEGYALSSQQNAKVLEQTYNDEQYHNGKTYLILQGKEISLYPLIPPLPSFHTFFLGSKTLGSPEAAERFGDLEVNKSGDIVLEILQKIEPKLRKLTVISSGGIPILHGDIGLSRLIPINFLGEGITKLAAIITYMVISSNGVLLIDEIENGFHYSVLPMVWQCIGDVARKFNTQIFATTHSLECINAAHESLSKNEANDFLFFRLDSAILKGKSNPRIRAVRYDTLALSAALESYFEVR